MNCDCPTLQFDRRTALIGLAAAAGFAPLATRAAPARREGQLIDVHHHIFPPFYLEGKAGEVASRSKGFTQVLEWTPEKSLAEMDAAGTTASILSMSAPVWFGDVGEARALAARSNEYARDLKRKHPGRFGYFAVLPMPDVEGSVIELERALSGGEADGVALLTNYDARYLGDPRFAPVLEAIDRRGAIAYVHPTVASCCQNLVTDLAPAFLELPFDSSRAIASLLYSGTLSRYRRIRWIFSHGGGTIPFLADRLTQWAKARPDLADRFPDGPMAELQRLNFDTASVTNIPAMAAIGKFVPWQQVLFGTDYPYVGTAPQRIELHRAGLSAADLALVEYGNAERLGLLPAAAR